MRRQVRAMMGAAALGLGVAAIESPAFAQDKIPTLPPTKIEAKPPTVAQPIPDAPTTVIPAAPIADAPAIPSDVAPATASAGAPFSTGGIFASPVDTGYGAPSFTTGSIVDIPRMDFPGSVGVITAPTIQDQQALKIDDLLRDISGAQKLGDFRRPDAFLLRGFEVTSRSYRWNGFLDPSFAPRDVQSIQRIEVLKGPSSVLYGGGQPSGTVNVITKRAQPTFGGTLGYEFGSFSLSRPTLDVNTPIGDNMAVRLNGVYQDADSFRDFGYDDRMMLAPTFSVLLSEDTLLEFQGQYTRDRGNLDSGIAAINGNPRAMAIQTSLNQPTDFRRFNDYKNGLWLTQKLGDNWTARVGGYAGWYDLPSQGTVPILGGSDPAIAFLGLPPSVFARQVQTGIHTNESYYSFIANLAGDVDGRYVRHKLLFGTELGWLQSNNSYYGFSDPLSLTPIPFPPFFFPQPSSPINAASPNYGLPQPGIPGALTSSYRQNRYGFFAQDFVDVTERLKLLAGVRYDVVDFTFNRAFRSPFGGFDLGFPQTDTNTNYYHISPRIGATYFLIPEVASVYGSYSQSFDPPPGGAYRNNTPLNPETGDAFEGGFRFALLEKKLLVDLTGFNIEKQNVTTQDTFFFATQVGTVRSRGFESSATGLITDRWSVIANYSYIDSRITESAVATQVGNRFRNVPYNTLNFWSRYNLIDSEQQTFGLALGMTALSDRPGDLNNSFELPSYVRWDAGMYYRYSRLFANLYVENLFDRRYETGSVDQFSIFPGAPITARATVGITF